MEISLQNRFSKQIIDVVIAEGRIVYSVHNVQTLFHSHKKHILVTGIFNDF